MHCYLVNNLQHLLNNTMCQMNQIMLSMNSVFLIEVWYLLLSVFDLMMEWKVLDLDWYIDKVESKHRWHRLEFDRHFQVEQVHSKSIVLLLFYHYAFRNHKHCNHRLIELYSNLTMMVLMKNCFLRIDFHRSRWVYHLVYCHFVESKSQLFGL